MLHGRKAYSGSWATTEPCTRVRWVCVVGICWLNGKPFVMHRYLDSKVPAANMGPIWGRQDPGGPHVGPMNFAIWVVPYILPLNHSFLAVSNIKQNSLFCFCYIFRGQFYQFASTDPGEILQPISEMTTSVCPANFVTHGLDRWYEDQCGDYICIDACYNCSSNSARNPAAIIFLRGSNLLPRYQSWEVSHRWAEHTQSE